MLTLIWAILICIVLITTMTIKLPNEIWLSDVLESYHATLDNIYREGWAINGVDTSDCTTYNPICTLLQHEILSSWSCLHLTSYQTAKQAIILHVKTNQTIAVLSQSALAQLVYLDMDTCPILDQPHTHVHTTHHTLTLTRTHTHVHTHTCTHTHYTTHTLHTHTHYTYTIHTYKQTDWLTNRQIATLTTSCMVLLKQSSWLSISKMINIM